MPTALITGSNRGIGLAWVRRLTDEGWQVRATCRHPADAHDLQALAQRHDSVVVQRLDVTVPDDVRAVAWDMEDVPIDLLVLNAGIYLEKGTPALGCIRYDDWLHSLVTNVLGQVRIVEALADNVAASDRRLVVSTTSHMGSIADITAPGDYYYRSSKAALNAAMRGLAAELATRRVGLLLLHPGGVATRMGPHGGLAPEASVDGMFAIVQRFTPDMSGRFYRHDGAPMPW